MMDHRWLFEIHENDQTLLLENQSQSHLIQPSSSTSTTNSLFFFNPSIPHHLSSYCSSSSSSTNSSSSSSSILFPKYDQNKDEFLFYSQPRWLFLILYGNLSLSSLFSFIVVMDHQIYCSQLLITPYISFHYQINLSFPPSNLQTQYQVKSSFKLAGS